MAGDGPAPGVRYSPAMGLIYIFNLIVGTGALTLPAAFHDAGWILSSIILVLLAFMSYLTATFVIESMAAANALLTWNRLQAVKRSQRKSRLPSDQSEANEDCGEGCSSSSSSPLRRASSAASLTRAAGSSSSCSPLHRAVSNHSLRSLSPEGDSGESDPLLEKEGLEKAVETGSYYEITQITEMGQMSTLFFNPLGRNLFYVCLVIYLYGDLAIYGAAVAKSLRDVACNFRPDNSTNSSSSISSFNLSESTACWSWSQGVSRLDAYRIFLATFVCSVGQFVFCNVTKTKYLQILTTLMRWLAFTIMVVLAVMRLVSSDSSNSSRPDRPAPSPFLFLGLPNLFGVCVYSFMCHHSLPSLVTPISKKKYLSSMVLADYTLILSFYMLLAFTGIFAFSEINDLYTLNFQPEQSDSWAQFLVHIFLSLFPVFTISTNFPIIALTLSNNLKALCLREGRSYSYFTRHVMFPVLALLPPTCVAMATHSLELLVGVTGSYAGTGIQYVVPAALVYFGRKKTAEALGVGVENHHTSPFRSVYWVVFVQIWAALCLIFVTWNHLASL